MTIAEQVVKKSVSPIHAYYLSMRNGGHKGDVKSYIGNLTYIYFSFKDCSMIEFEISNDETIVQDMKIV